MVHTFWEMYFRWHDFPETSMINDKISWTIRQEKKIRMKVIIHFRTITEAFTINSLLLSKQSHSMQSSTEL